MWKFFRAWSVARITGSLPLAVWGYRGLPRLLPYCPCCAAIMIGLAHVLAECPATDCCRRLLPALANGSWVDWCLRGSADVPTLRLQVKLLGLCMATMAHALAAGGFSETPDQGA
jgi:hypothetical protein